MFQYLGNIFGPSLCRIAGGVALPIFFYRLFAINR
jgi:hypothetical protein